jgi:AraC-like DNA-binding protein
VDVYARLLSIYPNYLNEAFRDIMPVNAKALIDEQILMRARYNIKFYYKTMKGISFSLGFSSPGFF